MNEFSVRDYGAAGDGTTLDTVAIQAAIDACTNEGGGIVFVPPGDYLTGTITLKDNVTLHVGPSARLLGSTSLADYPNLGREAKLDYPEHLDYCLINAYRARHVGLTGEGCVDGQGAAFPRGMEGFNLEERSGGTQRSDVHPAHPPSSHANAKTSRSSNLTLQHAPPGAVSWRHASGCRFAACASSIGPTRTTTAST